MQRFGRTLILGLLLAAAPAPAGESRLAGRDLDAHLRAVKRIAAGHLRDRVAREVDGLRRAGPPRPPGLTRPAEPSGAAAIPSNVKVNNSMGDSPSATQSETSVASLGDNVLVVWNDGQGSSTGGAYQGHAWSTDGGQTFVDGGDPPKPAAFPAFRWTFDPVVTVNEKTGVFYYCAMANSDASHNAIAVARGSFTGGALVWQDVQVVREEINTAAFLDKPWIVADSSGAGTHVYVANVTFTPSGNKIDFFRSTDSGDTWGNATRISSIADGGYVHGPRPVVEPDGTLHVLWRAIGQGVPEDFERARTSTNRGQSFLAEVTAASHILNFGTGGPGYNRERALQFPSVAVDRTAGPQRGRVYLAWTECYNFQDDALGTGVSRVEVEPDDFVASATPFTPGEVLRGATASVAPADQDYWSFALAAGQSIVALADSLPSGQTYALRIFAAGPDTSESMAFGGDISPGSFVNQAYFTFTAPVAGTYTLRLGPYDGSSTTGGYRIRTGFGVRDAERGRDQRDVFVTWSDDGATWSTPAQVNDDAVGLDNFLAEVAVGADGCPYVTWHDYRDEAYGAWSHVYVSRSTDGGAAWAANQRLTSVSTRWQQTLSNLAPNMGDYHGLGADDHGLHVAWADGRDGSADVYGARLDTRHTLTSCAPDAAVPAGMPVTLTWQVRNDNDLFANDYSVSLSSQRAWTLTGPSSATVAAATTGAIAYEVSVPDTASPGINVLTLTVTNAKGTLSRSCAVNVTVLSPVAVDAEEAAFALGSAIPNPARARATIAFALPSRGKASLRIYGLSGDWIRTLADGEFAAGLHRVAWDGRDARGRPVPSGAYFYRLESAGLVLSRRMVWLR